ncbi:hypothetical protein [Massilia genomosp. 1]|uniref:Tail fiber protein n=1 Tax=Massilia genomosp. 1 TaxID=2609280 RepID=A0ABX0MWQ6_9BURK|nr:hypothetical protein [Massilia genomosp. 1]NHZ67201.1 hypothetical protein [Massilia genomosp. 1]
MSANAERAAHLARTNPFGPEWNYMGEKSAGFSKEPTGTAALGINLSMGTGMADQFGVAINGGANGSKPTLAVFNSYGGTVGTDFGPAVAVTYVKGNTGENFAGDRSVSNYLRQYLQIV